MRHFTLIFLIFFCASLVYGQELPSDKIEEAVASYEAKIEQATTLVDCGHALDGPAYFLKQMENSWLDAMLLVASDSKNSIGSEIYANFKRLNSIDTNHNLYPKVQEVLKNLLKHTSVKSTVYRLNILKSEEINAFATLGGYLYVTSGLLEFVDSYDELAFIIGHEIAHEERLHTQRKVTKLTLLSDIENLTRMEGFTDIAKKINSTFSAPFDQIDEYEADKNGFDLAKAAGYDTTKFADFFKKLEKNQQQDLLKKLTSTHPFAEHRKKCIANYISQK